MRVLLIDDHALFRRGLRLMLREVFPTVDVSEADGCAAGADMHELSFDLIFLDWNMPGIQGELALDAIKLAFPPCPVVVMSGEEDASVIRSAIARGAAGYVPKAAKPEVMLGALQLILAGGVYLPPQVLGAAQGAADAPARPPSPLSELTDRQLEVLRRALKGTPNKLIARDLAISEGTVKSHLSSAFRALDVRNRTEALYSAAKLGLRL
ncbi:MAG: response regulator transcription factor [Comamonadaceae bacterium]|nr:response regulator transcription factor [Comamonadaceae bacterium]